MVCAVHFRLLGPVEVDVDGQRLDLGRRQQRCVLGVLALAHDRVVPVERLADLLWDGTPPDLARSALHAHISRLRKCLMPVEAAGVRLVTRGSGYMLRMGSAAVDVDRFRSLVAQTTLWDTGRRAPRAIFTDSSVFITSLAVSPDGRTVATVTESAKEPFRAPDNTLTLWDAVTGGDPVKLTGHTDRVLDVTFSPDGRTIATTSVDQTVIIWDAARHTRLATLKGHTQAVNGVAFSPDGRTIATAGHDQTVRLWDAATGTQRASMSHPGWTRSVVFSPDGRTLATASVDQTVILWDTDAGQVASQMCQGLARSLTAEEWHRLVPELPYHKTCETP